MIPLPAWLKSLYDWSKVIGFIVGAVSLVSGYVFGREKGFVIACLVVGLGIFLYVLVFAVSRAFAIRDLKIAKLILAVLTTMLGALIVLFVSLQLAS